MKEKLFIIAITFMAIITLSPEAFAANCNSPPTGSYGPAWARDYQSWCVACCGKFSMSGGNPTCTPDSNWGCRGQRSSGAAPGMYNAFYGLGYQLGTAIGKALVGDPQEQARRQAEEQMRAAEQARAAQLARIEAEAREAARKAEEARKRQETFDRLSSQLQLSEGYGGKGDSLNLMLGDGDDGLRPQGTSFFGLGGGKERSNLNSDSKVVDLRPRQGYSAEVATNSGGTLSLMMGDPDTDSKVVDLRDKKAFYKEGEFYALQTRTLMPMKDGGHPIDTLEQPPVSLHGLVGGTTWTFGFKWPHKECNKKCLEDTKRNLDAQLGLYCSSQSDQKKCTLPFTKESYDLVVSMGSSHNAIQDLATRVVWDGLSFGEFSRQNANIFASLKGRQFDTLDCHSNGAMLCLAALRSGDTTAKTVRLFGPQINAQAAARWREWADNTGANIKIYINNGDPVPAISWKQPTPQTTIEKAFNAAWLTNPVVGPATIADALMYSWIDSKSATMDNALRDYGFKVNRFYSPECNSPDIKCHSMLLYEKNARISPAQH